MMFLPVIVAALGGAWMGLVIGIVCSLVGLPTMLAVLLAAPVCYAWGIWVARWDEGRR